MSKHIDSILYGLTLLYCFAITGMGMGDTSHITTYMGQRAIFYLAESVLLIIVMIRCRKLSSDYDSDYFKTTEKILAAADCCFVMIGMVVLFSAAEIILIFIFLPENIFKFGAANGFFVMLAVTALVFWLHSLAAKEFGIVKKKKEEMLHHLGEKTEDFFAFINSLDEVREEEPDVGMDDVSYLLGETVSDEERAEGVQKAVVTTPLREPKQLWECPCCGSLNSVDSQKCDFCGTEAEYKLP
ncbi:MAG: hypothetical protein K2K41_05830 [Ruminiclostridium sp.]|nr:hypothetical protein [Ruminiclostridium sp.]